MLLQTPVAIPQFPWRGWQTADVVLEAFVPGVLKPSDQVSFQQCPGCGRDGNFFVIASDATEPIWAGKVWTHEDAVTMMQALRSVMSVDAWNTLYQQVRTANWFPDFTQLPAEPPPLAPNFFLFGMVSGVLEGKFRDGRFVLVWDIDITIQL